MNSKSRPGMGLLSSFRRFKPCTANRATAIGAGASAAFAGSAAFGAGATTSRADQQAFGTASSTYTFSGVTSAGSSAAQTGPLQVVTTDANGNIAGDGGRM